MLAQENFTVGNTELMSIENTLSDCKGGSGLNGFSLNDENLRRGVELCYGTDSLESERDQHISRWQPGIEIIIGDDDREPAFPLEYPYCAIALLVIFDKYNRKYFGSGFFISPTCIITSGHCVYDLHEEWFKEIHVIPGARGNKAPFGSAVSKKFRTVEGWAYNGDRSFDHGAVILEDDQLYQRFQAHLGYGLVADESEVEVSGYPIDKTQTQWRSFGRISKKTSEKLYYDADTVRGHSGSPVFIRRAAKRLVIGVHCFGQNPNFSVRLTQEKINRWEEWTQI